MWYLALMLIDEHVTGFEDVDRFEPMVLIYVFKPSSPNAKIVSGVLATAYSLAVALLTLISVACADRMTEINNSNEE